MALADFSPAWTGKLVMRSQQSPTLWQGFVAEDRNLWGHQHVHVHHACHAHWTSGHSVTAVLCNQACQHWFPVLLSVAHVALLAACWNQMTVSGAQS